MCLEQTLASGYLWINYDKSTSIQSIRLIELNDTARSVSEGRTSSNCNLERMGVGDQQ